MKNCDGCYGTTSDDRAVCLTCEARMTGRILCTSHGVVDKPCAQCKREANARRKASQGSRYSNPTYLATRRTMKAQIEARGSYTCFRGKHEVKGTEFHLDHVGDITGNPTDLAPSCPTHNQRAGGKSAYAKSAAKTSPAYIKALINRKAS